MSELDHRQFSVREIAAACGAKLAGNGSHGDATVRRVAPISDADAESVTWIADRKLLSVLPDCNAAAIIGRAEFVAEHAHGLIVDDPETAIANILDCFYTPLTPPPMGVDPGAWVDPTAHLGKDVSIGRFAVIGAGCNIGDRVVIHEGVSLGTNIDVGEDSVIYDRCTIYDRCQIGRNVIIHAGSVIGADGFGYIHRGGRHRKLMHLGSVVIEDDVEIGANTTIDRGKLGATRIGRGSKIDNLVMIAHNVQVGPMCIITAQCGLAGSVTVGTGVAMGGQVGIIHGMKVGDGAQLSAQSGIMSDIPAGQTVFGSPAEESKEAFRTIARTRKLSHLMEQVAKLEKRIAELEAAADHSKAD